MHLHVQAMPDDPSMQAFLYGPLVLAGDLGGDGLTEAHIIGPNLRVGAPNTEQYGSPLGRQIPRHRFRTSRFRRSGLRVRIRRRGSSRQTSRWRFVLPARRRT